MIDVVFSNPSDFSVDLSGIEATVSRVFLAHDVVDARIGVMVVDEPTMTELNQNYKYHQGATDVLSFVLHDPEQPTPTFLETPESEREYGDIVLCYPVIAGEAKEQGATMQDQLEFLTEHACLHLLGIHHD